MNEVRRFSVLSESVVSVVSESVVSALSDHSPILCTCTTKFSLPNIFKFENFWLKLPDFKELMRQAWLQEAIAGTPKELNHKLTKLHKVIIRSWKKDQVGNITLQKKTCNKTLQWLDRASERRLLTQLELIARQLIITRLGIIVKLEEKMWRQRAKRM
jgi:hypothetical protein